MRRCCLLPFAHEDLAIVAGAYIINNELMPASLVAIGLYGGIVGSDFALYGIGAGARRLPWLSRYADHRVQRFSENMRRNIFGLVTLCRFVPGVVFVAFIACGWSRVSLTRFLLASLVVSAIYLPLTLYLVLQFGTALDGMIGWWTWPLLLAGMATFGLMRKKVFAFNDASARAALPRTGGHDGMPFLAGHRSKVATRRTHSAGIVLFAADRELDAARHPLPQPDLAERRQSRDSDRRHVG